MTYHPRSLELFTGAGELALGLSQGRIYTLAWSSAIVSRVTLYASTRRSMVEWRIRMRLSKATPGESTTTRSVRISIYWPPVFRVSRFPWAGFTKAREMSVTCSPCCWKGCRHTSPKVVLVEEALPGPLA